MITRLSKIKSIIFPNKKINYTVITILLLGVTTGAIFSTIIDINDQKIVTDKIELFTSNINTGNINNIKALQNSILFS